MLMSYLLVGWAVRLLARHWDVADLRVQCLTTAAGCLLTTAGAVWLDDLWSWPLMGWICVRVAATALVVPLLCRLAPGRSG